MNAQVITKDQLLAQARRPSGQGIRSQATHVEQARAIAQVQGALVVAQERPRDTLMAFERMREACSLQALAERAFFSFPRAGQQIAGPSVHLATELARCWGNVDYGITELRRDSEAGESEMQAYAWDQETNTRVTNSFIVPHTRDTKRGPVTLTDSRDLYENNANQGARRLRECIFRILPVSFREEAEAICSRTLEEGGGEPIEQRRDKMLAAFAELKVSRRMIEARMETAADRLTARQLATLSVIYQTLRRGETTVSAEFTVDEGESVAAELRRQTAPQKPNGGEQKSASAARQEQVPAAEPPLGSDQDYDWDRGDSLDSLINEPAPQAAAAPATNGKAKYTILNSDGSPARVSLDPEGAFLSYQDILQGQRSGDARKAFMVANLEPLRAIAAVFPGAVKEMQAVERMVAQ